MDATTECPVCFEAMPRRTEGRNAAFVFPCAHRVCGRCNDRLLQRNDLKCPLCRKPREGVSEEAANRAAEFRALVDRAEDDGVGGGDGDFHTGPEGGVGVGGIVQRAGRRYEVLFFVNQASGDPFESLDSAADRLRRRVQTAATAVPDPSARVLRRPRLERARSAASATATASPAGARGRGSSRVTGRAATAAAGHGAAFSDREASPALQRPFAIDPNDVNLHALVAQLLQPTPMADFLSARQRVSASRAR